MTTSAARVRLIAAAACAMVAVQWVHADEVAVAPAATPKTAPIGAAPASAPAVAPATTAPAVAPATTAPPAASIAPTAPRAAAKPMARTGRPRDPLLVDAQVSVKDTPRPTVDLPGVLKIEGADRDLLDPTRVRKIFWRNGGTERVNVSNTQVNRIQLPFNNPTVVATTDVGVQRRAASNNVYVTFNAGSTRPVQMWLEMPGGGSVAVGLELVPTAIPAQTVVVVDDAPAGVSGASPASRQRESDVFAHAQSVLQDAALGGALDGFSQIDLDLPVIGVDGLAVVGQRRFSSHDEDVFVYSVANPGTADVTLLDEQFDGPDVTAVSIVPRPLLHPGERAIVAILSKKRGGS